MNTIRTIIVDDHVTFRRTLRKFVQTLGGVEVVGEAAEGLEAIELTNTLRPQLVLMDIRMPQMDGKDSCREMKQDDSELTVVLYSADLLEIELAAAQGLADFCLSKDRLFDDLPSWIGDTFTFSQ